MVVSWKQWCKMECTVSNMTSSTRFACRRIPHISALFAFMCLFPFQPFIQVKWMKTSQDFVNMLLAQYTRLFGVVIVIISLLCLQMNPVDCNQSSLNKSTLKTQYLSDAIASVILSAIAWVPFLNKCACAFPFHSNVGGRICSFGKC